MIPRTHAPRVVGDAAVRGVTGAESSTSVAPGKAGRRRRSGHARPTRPVPWPRARLHQGRLRLSGVAVARPPRRHRRPDVGARHRRAHRPPPAVPRADPARAEGRRARALQARRRRRLRAGPRPGGHPAVRDRVGRRRPDHARRLRPAAPGRRLRPRGPVRADRRVERGRRVHAPPPRQLHARQRRRDGPGRRHVAGRARSTSPTPSPSADAEVPAPSAAGRRGRALRRRVDRLEGGEERREVGGQRAGERQALAGRRVVERQLGGVQERAGRGRASCAGRRRSGRRRSGWPTAARWTRIWCVRPVSSTHDSRASVARARRSARRTWYSVRAGLPSTTTAIRSGSPGSRPIGASMMPWGASGWPHTTAS